MRFLVTGASGLIGRRVVRKCFERGHEITIVAREPERARSSLGIPCKTFHWEASAAQPIPAEALQDVDVVLNFAGESLATGAWTGAKKERIYKSRVAGTRALVESIQNVPRNSRPRTLISASAIGVYGDRGDEILTDDSDPADTRQDFLAQVCADWEKQVFGQPIEGVRAVAVRLGIVLARGGGALEMMLPAFKLGVGGVIGSGKQWMSWVHIDDVLEGIFFLLDHDSIQGSVNLTSPNPVTNREFTRTLARTVSRPAYSRLPAIGLRFALGEKSSMVLASQRVVPARLDSAGFCCRYDRLNDALRDLCDGSRFETVQWVSKEVAEVFSFFSDVGNLEKITPPWLRLRMLERAGAQIHDGTLIRYRLKLHGVPVKWCSRIDRWEPGRMFRDTQVKGPYHRWEHEHWFLPVAGGTLIRDRVTYELPFGIIAESLAGRWIANDIRAVFRYRRKSIEEVFQQ